MRAWFARHGPDARNGGTSYPGYCQWLDDGMPMDKYTQNRGAVAWLLWGGDATYNWLKSSEVRDAIQAAFPDRKPSSTKNHLHC